MICICVSRGGSGQGQRLIRNLEATTLARDPMRRKRRSSAVSAKIGRFCSTPLQTWSISPGIVPRFGNSCPNTANYAPAYPAIGLCFPTSDRIAPKLVNTAQTSDIANIDRFGVKLDFLVALFQADTRITSWTFAKTSSAWPAILRRTTEHLRTMYAERNTPSEEPLREVQQVHQQEERIHVLVDPTQQDVGA